MPRRRPDGRDRARLRGDLGMRGFVAAPRRELGHDPDYRFTLANERTFLAWIRTALALMAGGLVLIQAAPTLLVPYAREGIGGGLVLLGTVIAGASYRRWAATEEALRTDAPLPPSRLPALLAAGAALIAVLATVAFLAASVGDAA